MRVPDWLFPSLDDIVAPHPCICHGAYVHAPVLAHLQQETAMSDFAANLMKVRLEVYTISP